MVERRITLVETELTDAPIVTPDLAKISEALAAMPCSPYKGTYIGASEWADIVNAAWFACGGSEEGYKLADEWCRGWFFYKVEDLRKRWDNCAKFPPQGFDANTLFKLAAKKTEREQALNEVAQLPDLDYEEQRTKLAKARGLRVSKLDEERKKRLKRGTASAPPAPKPTIEQLAEAAKDIVACKDVLAMFAESISHRLAGESAAAQLIYLCGTSRLFDEPMNVVIKGQSAIGKSHLFDSVFHYMPPEDVFSFTTLTEKALIYLQDDLKHEILRVAEAVGVGKERETTDYILREIITNHRITHWVVVAAAPGEVPVTRRVDKEGPVMFATTTTKAELHPEMETRFLSMEIDDTQKQTRRVLVKIAQTRGGGFGGAAPDIASWHAYQRLLAMGERRVVLPFAETLAKHPGLDDKPVRMWRDFLQVIDAIKAHALLHRTHRKRDDQGRIVANIEDDYDVVRWLLNNRLAQGLGSQLKPTLLRVFDAVEACIDKDKGVTVQTIVEKLKLEQTTANRRLLKLASYGLLENLTPGRGRAAHYVVSGQPAEREALPSTDDLLEAWNKETHTHTEPTP